MRIVLNNKTIIGLFLAGFVIFGGQVAFAQTQSLVTLEDFLEDDEPSQDVLPPPADETAPISTSVNQQLEDVVVEPDADDALPNVESTRLPIQTDGFNYTAEQGNPIPLQGLDPEQKTPEELAEEIRREAYDAAITGLFPLRPEGIKNLLKEYDKTRRAVEEPVYGVPTPQVNVQTISLDPGVAPMILKTATGHITTLNLLDATGAPWPIQDVSWAGDFEVIQPEEGSHIIRITPLSATAYGNMSIRMLTLKTPITIMLKTSVNEVQYRVDARIPELGPFAEAQLIEGGSELVAGNQTVISVLDGTPPQQAISLSVSGVDGRTKAYRLNNRTYVRTPLTLLSPGWEQSVSSADGMNVYVLNNTPVLLLSDNGRSVRANLTEEKTVFDDGQ